MRMPRVRFTIGRLMAVILAAGLASWAFFVVRPRLINQYITIQQNDASYKQARLVREVAEYALKEYTQGIYLKDQSFPSGQIATGKSDQERALDRLAWSRTTLEAGVLQYRNPEAERIVKNPAGFDWEQALLRREALEKSTKDKQILSLQSDIARARADEAAKLSSYLLERSKRWWTLLGF